MQTENKLICPTFTILICIWCWNSTLEAQDSVELLLLLIAHASIKLNKMDIHSLTGIFASNNGIIQVIYMIFILEIIFGNHFLLCMFTK